ncbi:MAG: hypothetical protein IJJ69_12320 [Oscillospiraceae bacterium]|nr:hypothetical protein [Oscillospiraceae bacterium]
MKKIKKQHKSAHRTMLLIILVYLTIIIGTVRNFKLSEFPVPEKQTLLNGTWTGELETFLKQNLGFHDMLFQFKSQTDLIIGEKMIQGVYITDERLIEKQVSAEAGNAGILNHFYQEYHIPTYLVLVPSASEIYESTLPANALNANQEKMIKSIYSDTETGIRCVDAYHILSSLKESYIYYRTDSHWTSYGAYYIYQSAIQKMGFTPVSYQKYVISHLSTDFRGDLYQKTLYDGIKPDVLDCYTYEKGSEIKDIRVRYQDGTIEKRSVLYDKSALETDEMYRFYLGEPCQRMIIRTNLDNGKKLLLYKDDFGDCIIPFLLQHYSEICIVNLEQTGNQFQDVAEPSDYTQAMFLCSVKKWQEIFQ